MMKVGQSIICNTGAILTKVSDAQPMGEYKPTSIDAHKQSVDFRLIQVAPKMITWNATGKTERITDNKFDKLKSLHTWTTDF